jgi:hypothetical protein
MVWAVERMVPSALGGGTSGFDVARAATPPPLPPLPDARETSTVGCWTSLAVLHQRGGGPARGGKTVKRAFQRARWLDGGTFLWVGRSVTPGRGGSSGLAFDQVVDVREGE